MNQAKVGVFFKVQKHLLIDAVPLEKGETYGDAINFGGHFDYWDALNPKDIAEQLFKNHAYDYFPRGRVVFFKKTGDFKIYTDRCITKDEIEKIAAEFQLPNFQLAHDEHYQCAICNPEYLD